MNYAWDAILGHVARKIGEVTETTVEPSDLGAPPDAKLGDLAFGCFVIAKAQKKSPADIAKEIAKGLSSIKKDHLIERAEAAGPYVNITLKSGEVVSRVVQDVEHAAKEYGASDIGEKKTVLFEYANPNTHKELHVGHLRNIVLGVSLARILQRTGNALVPISYINDVGSNVGKTLWELVRRSGADVRSFDAKALKKLLAGIPKEQRTGNWLGKIYSDATIVLAEDESHQEDISFVQQKLEDHDKTWESLWSETRAWCLEEMSDIFDELGVRIEKQYLESALLDRSHDVVKDLLKRGIAKESEGAVIVDFEDKKLGVAVLRKTDGTLLYSAKDLALAEWKMKDFPELATSWVLVDHRQSLYFRQLAEILKRMGVKPEFGFIGYELVTLAEGTMSSRKGNIVTFQSFRDEVVRVAREETIQRHTDWPEGKVTYTAWCIAMAGMKYGILKQDPDKVIVFDLKRALAFDGDTGPYILYAATRLSSILKKANWSAGKGMKDGDLIGLEEDSERRLAIHVAQFPAIVRRAGTELKPSIIAQWCFAMAHHINDFYRDVNVLDEENATFRAARLRLVASALSTLILGLDLLGIPLPEEM